MPNPKYFTNFPTTTEDYFGIRHRITNLNRYVRISPDVLQSKYAFYDYVIRDGERPDHVAYFEYGNTKYYWIVLIANGIYDLWRQWPMTNEELRSYIAQTYGSIQNAKDCTYRYIRTDSGIIIDEETANSLQPSEYVAESCYDYEDERNEAKREIRLIQPRHLTQFVSELNNLFEG